MIWFTLLVLFLLIARMLADWALELLNRRSVLAAAGDIPAAYRGVVDEATYDRSVAYTLAKIRLSLVETGYDALVLGLVLFSGVLPLLWQWGAGIVGTGIWAQALLVYALLTVLSLLSLPFEWYHQFRLEERFGFNRSSIGLWISDKLKGMVIAAVLGIPALAALVWLVGTTQIWWFWGFALFAILQLVLIVVYPMFILPLFNKFEPLPEGELRQRLMALADRTGFRASTILVMDGSRRSAHSNAYFTGFGRFRRIVLFDTLMEQMQQRALEAVLAHEIGHYKLGHIPRLLLLSLGSLLLTFAVLGWLAASDWFVAAFGFDAATGIGPVILLFALLAGLFSFWTAPLMNALSRRHEYQADAFARQAMDGDPQPLVDALRTLSTSNLSNLTPHPLYSAFHYSHPTLLEREAALRGGG
jgi:STE24 endopeptidase